ncbi:DUF262 domain-containing protein [Wenzhouxiangella marina]|uniref:GmrSD restriction endonucleases N-terminal domain-containing protein n=1 Tax=Wenzhouxiangella marina TaxID=1579979 RepID=A0A0K0XU97_9GAMM|nr:DUF262 domain-containing protein [Wenzhouxiangella marina]AKS41258.1 hypothetical protein WM2015_877 [Wenzhouxiangella marina]MBB6086993.1 hypothetical protein [Wenzhouxiangella marina]
MTDIIQHLKEEENDFYSDDDLFKISSWGADLSFRELIARYDDNELVKPELQRKYVWDRTEASRFIDSLLLGLPVPSIFLAKASDERMLIIDGYQRIMTVYDFVRGIYSGDGKVFKLSRSEKINSRWRGKAFAELGDAEQRRIRNTTIHAIIFVQDQPSDTDTSLYQVFERINTSGRTLMPQEIRNCVYQGVLNDLLIELNKTDDWRSLFGGNEDARMRDMEFILRFYALDPSETGAIDKERISLKKHLNQFMKRNSTAPNGQLEEFRARFLGAMRLIHETWGKSAFHNVSPTDPNRLVRKFSPTIFDSISIAAAVALHQGLGLAPGDAESNRRRLLHDPDYRTAISKETMTKDSITRRTSLAIEYLFGAGHEE